jgi:deoxycytidylate deaminase
MNSKEMSMFLAAKAVAKTSDYDGVHIGCVVCYGRNILSVASNSKKTHTLQMIYNKFKDFDTSIYQNKVHAEVHALSWLIGKEIDWSKVSVYIYREWKDGTPAISKPCPSCYHLMKDLGIKYVYYIDKFGVFTKRKVSDMIDEY